MNKVTVGFTYYKNPQTLAYQLGLWKAFPRHIADNIQIVVVDDCSPVGQRAEEVIQANGLPSCDFTLARVVVDMPWNYGQGRNLVHHLAKNEWAFATDIDNAVTEKFLGELLKTQLDPETIYSFQRIQHFGGEGYMPHKETRLMTRAMFWDKIGPFDETCTGHYSFVDRTWMWRIRDSGFQKVELPISLEHLSDNVILDSKTRELVRKEGRDDAAWKDILEWKKVHRIGIQALRLPWKVVIQQLQNPEFCQSLKKYPEPSRGC